MSSEPVVSLRDVVVRFGGVHALKGVSLDIGDGEVIGMMGPNGSGKTTLVNCTSGVLVPFEGRVMLDGRDITRWSRPRRARHGLIRTYQNLRLFGDMTAAENVEVGLVGAKRGGPVERRKRVAAALTMQRLTKVASVPVRELSYGEQRRVEIARALVSAPRVLLLDEPAAGLGEPETAVLEEAIRRACAEMKCAVLLIDHDVNFVLRLSERVVVLHEGTEIYSGMPSGVHQSAAVSDVYLGSPAPIA